MEYTVSNYGNFCSDQICEALHRLNKDKIVPMIICVGSDLVVGDSLGPLVGTLLKKRNVDTYVYGSLDSPVTAKEIEYVKLYVDKVHANWVSIVIDAAVGAQGDVGQIKIRNEGIKPGLGVNKNLDEIGDISIIGVVAEKSINNYSLFNKTRLSFIYDMAEKIASGIEKSLKRLEYLQSV